MLTAASALRWEMSRNLRWRLLWTFFGMLFIPTLTILHILEGQLRGRPLSIEQTQVLPAVHMAVTIINLGLCLFGIGQGVGMSVRHYSLPVTSQMLATVRLLPGAACCAGLYLCISSLFNFVFRVDWPGMGPALTYGVAYMVAYSTLYRFRGHETRVGIGGLAFALLLILWVAGHYVVDNLDRGWWKHPPHAWPVLSATELVVLLTIGFVSWLSLVDAIDRDRRGVGWGRVIESTDAATIAATTFHRRRAGVFRSSFTALFWQEWKLDGWLIPIVTVGLQSIFATIHVTTLTLSAERRMLEILHETEVASILFAFLPMCAVVPWFLSLSGQHGRRAAASRLPPTSLMTLPLSDALVGWAYASRVLASSLVAMLGVLCVGAMWFGAVELIQLVAHDMTRRPLFPVGSGRPSTDPASTYVFSLIVGLWLSVGISCAATLSGRRWIAAAPLLVVPGWFFFLIFAGTFLRHGAFDLFAGVVGLSVLIAMNLGMLAAFVVAYDRGLIGYRTILVGLLLCGTTEIIGIELLAQARAFVPGYGHQANNGMILLLLSLSAAPPALIPLATYFNRHR